MVEEVTIRNGVIFGKEDYLFLADGGHAVLDIVTGKKSVVPASFANFESNILSRSRKASQVGCEYAHVVFPDKQSVMIDQFPWDDVVCLGDVYQARCRWVAEHVLNLAPLLREQVVPPFQRTDTHMSDHGVVASAAAIAAHFLQRNVESELAELRSKITVQRVTAGDLGKRFAPELTARELFMLLDWPQTHLHNDMTAGNDGMIDIFISPSAVSQKRVLWFGDSFGRACCRALSYFFREIVFLRTRFLHDEMLRQIRPDILITQNVERYMDFVAADEEAPSFLLYPHLKQLPYSPSKRFSEVLSALMSFPRSAYMNVVEAMYTGLK